MRDAHAQLELAWNLGACLPIHTLHERARTPNPHAFEYIAEYKYMYTYGRHVACSCAYAVERACAYAFACLRAHSVPLRDARSGSVTVVLRNGSDASPTRAYCFGCAPSPPQSNTVVAESPARVHSALYLVYYFSRRVVGLAPIYNCTLVRSLSSAVRHIAQIWRYSKGVCVSVPMNTMFNRNMFC